MRYDLLPHHTDIRLDPAVPAKITETRVGDLIPMDPEDEDDGCIVENRLVSYVKDEEEEEEKEEGVLRIKDFFSDSTVTRSGRRSIQPPSADLSSVGMPTSSSRRTARTPKKSDSGVPKSDSPLKQSSSLRFTSKKPANTFPVPPFPVPPVSLPAISLSPVTLKKNGEEKKMFSSPAAAAAIAAAAINNAKLYQRTKKTAGEMRKKGRHKKYAKKPEPMSPCETCGKMFFSRFNMLRHVENVHMGLLPYLCKLCGKGFTQKNSMQKHMVKMHSNGKRRRPLTVRLAEDEASEAEEVHAVVSMDDEPFDEY